MQNGASLCFSNLVSSSSFPSPLNMHALLVICLLLVPSAYGSTATTFFYNKTNATLVLDYYSNAFGSFT
jgi:hypothetical protein